MTRDDPARIVFVGAGPRTTSLLERLAANAPEQLGDAPLAIDVIDPYPPGGGRIWRAAQSPLLWMNSVAADVAMYTDDSVRCAGPIRPGPTLAEWVLGPGRSILEAAGLGDRAAVFSADDFASREFQSHYLAWVFARAVAALPASVTVSVHQDRATRVVDVEPSAARPRQHVSLAGGSRLTADIVVLAQGYLDREPTDPEREILDAADALGLTYVPPGYTADLDLSGIAGGEPGPHPRIRTRLRRPHGPARRGTRWPVPP